MHRLNHLVVNCLLCLCFLAVPWGAALAATPADPGVTPVRLLLPQISYSQPATPFGIQMYGALTDPAQNAPLAVAAGVSWVRWPISWAQIEPVNTTPDHYNFTQVDASVRRAAELNLRLIVTISGNPSWAATYSNGPIDKVPLAEFAQFVGALVERYDADGYQDAPGSPAVKMWELYNEPDCGSLLAAEQGCAYWGYNGQAYAAMLCAARDAAKAADPAAQIAMGGIAYDLFINEQGTSGSFVRAFIDDVLASGGGQCMDIMNFHYYPAFQAQWDPYGHGLTGKANYLRTKLSSYGIADKPFIMTEAGMHSNNPPGNPSSDGEQANYVVKLFTQSLAAQVKVMTWWTWIDPDLQTYCCANGLLTQQGVQKLAYATYGVAASKLSRAQFVREVPASETGSTAALVYQFSGAQTFYVAWVEGATASTISLPGSRFAVVDRQGVLQGYVTDEADGQADGRVSISIGPDPVYLEQVN